MEDKIIQIAIEPDGGLVGLGESGRVYWYLEFEGDYRWTKGPVSPPLPVIE